MTERQAILETGCVYHIFNHANGDERLFRNEGNYYFFLERYKYYISPIVDTFSYVLMPNHFHFLVRCKDELEVSRHFVDRSQVQVEVSATEGKFDLVSSRKKLLKKENFWDDNGRPKQREISRHLSLQFNHFFNSYSQAYNKQNRRMGGLFMRPYKRILVRDDFYFRKLVHYIHMNPVKGGIVRNPSLYPYSSYKEIVQGKNEFVNTIEVLDLFGTLNNFVSVHGNESDLDEV